MKNERNTQFHDAQLKHTLGYLKKIAVPESTITKLYKRIREGAYERKKTTSPLLSALLIKREIVCAVILTLIISIPLTFFFTRKHFSASELKKTYIVQFIYEIKDAEKVQIVGDFNNWSKDGIVMQKIHGTDFWTAQVSLQEGIYKYVFVINNTMWTTDPFSQIKVMDDFGNESSLIVLLNGSEESSRL